MSASCSAVPVHTLILSHGESRPNHTALLYPRGRQGYAELSFGELAKRAHAIAAGLAKRGVGRGDRVAVLIPMSPDLYAVILAVVSLGAVAVFVEPASSLAEIARAIKIARPRAFIAIARAHLLRIGFAEVARVPVNVMVGSSYLSGLAGTEALAAVAADSSASDRVAVDVRSDEPALLTFSSGSTGTPKGAVRSHGFLAAQHKALEGLVARPAGRDEVHLSAFAIALLSALASGTTAVIPRLGRGGVNDVSGDELVDLIATRPVDVISGSPAFVAPIVSAARRRRQVLASVRRVFSGGAPVPVSLCDVLDDQLLPKGDFVVVYGSTEAEPIATIDGAEVRRETGAATRAGAGLCVGVTDPHLATRLLVPTTAPLAIGPGGMDELTVTPGEVGEVSVRGPHVNRGYYRNRAAERATKVVDSDGGVWHRTGDAGYFDDRGRLWLVGRVANVVTRGSQSYYPAAVEAAAQSLDFVDRAALISESSGATLLLVQPRRWSRLLRVTGQRRAAQLITHLACREVVVDRVKFVAHLPVDPRHRAKLDLPTIRRRYQ